MFRRRGIIAMTVACSFFVLNCAVSAFAAVELPEKLKDVPLFPNSKIMQAMDMDATAMGTLTVKAAGAEAVSDFYKKSMKESGWKIVFQAQQENVHVIHFQKDSRLLHINIQSEEGGTITYNMVAQSQ